MSNWLKALLGRGNRSMAAIGALAQAASATATIGTPALQGALGEVEKVLAPHEKRAGIKRNRLRKLARKARQIQRRRAA